MQTYIINHFLVLECPFALKSKMWHLSPVFPYATLRSHGLARRSEIGTYKLYNVV